MATVNRADVLGVVPTEFSTEILKYTMPKLEFWKRIKTDITDKGIGDRAQLGTYTDTVAAPPSATQLHTGTATGFSGTAELDPLVATYADQTIGSVTVYLANWYYFAVEQSAYEQATANQNLDELFRNAGLDSVKTQIDSTVASLISGISTNTARGTLGVALVDDVIRD